MGIRLIIHDSIPIHDIFSLFRTVCDLRMLDAELLVACLCGPVPRRVRSEEKILRKAALSATHTLGIQWRREGLTISSSVR